ncbi:spore germination protein [Peribacillus butanolivorans]|uniref:spore germination protein n=1 Tax=Peribacillus butanolivorans TaxID=421767 RepID=UPI003D2C0B35
MMNHLWRKLLKSKMAKITPTVGQFKQEPDPLFDNLTNNENKFRSIYKDCSDVIFRPFFIGGKDKSILLYIEGLSNIEEIDDNVLSPLMQNTEEEFYNVNSLIEKKISVSNVKEIKTFSECIQEISSGNPVILVDKRKTGFSLGLSKWEKRSIEEPSAEMVVRGPRDAFVETLRVNTSLLRRKIRSPELKMQSIEIGRYTKTKVVITYMEGIADRTLIEETQNRLSRIEVDGILESGMIQELIEDNPKSPFPQVLATERPDVVTSNLLEGRVAILVDGTPFSIVVPSTFYSLLQSSEDYYERFLIGTAIRWLRYLFLVISLFLPALYVALITFHHEMIPTNLLISMAASREHVPFPALVEVLIMEVMFEALREAGLRLPKQIGGAVSIVGALVIGEAAVSAGIVSAPMVIVVAITGVASFTIPRYPAAIAIRMLRFPMILLAGTLGMLGIMLGTITIIIHLCTLHSFGVPYLRPVAPLKSSELEDVLTRTPWWKLNPRTQSTGEYNKYRQSNGQMPDPTSRGKE